MNASRCRRNGQGVHVQQVFDGTDRSRVAGYIDPLISHHLQPKMFNTQSHYVHVHKHCLPLAPNPTQTKSSKCMGAAYL